MLQDESRRCRGRQLPVSLFSRGRELGGVHGASGVHARFYTSPVLT